MAPKIDITWLTNDVLFNETYKIDILIKNFADVAYAVAEDLKINKSYVYVNKWGVFAALQRYSRDIFGFNRLKCCLESNGVNGSSLDKIMREVKHEYKGIGLRIVSEDPYMHKRIAFFIYYFSIIKPFSINYNQGLIGDLDEKKVKHIIHFNAIVLLSCVQLILLSFKSENETGYEFIDKKYIYDQDFIHDLTYRSLNRSSLEAAMRHMIRMIPKEKYNAELDKFKETLLK